MSGSPANPPTPGGDPMATPVPAGRLVEIIANAYHWAARNSCGPDNCPGVPECVYAEHLSWEGFQAGLAALSEVPTCCDMHNQHCEPPGDLCCAGCTEAAHDTFPIRHGDGSRCVLEPSEQPEYGEVVVTRSVLRVDRADPTVLLALEALRQMRDDVWCSADRIYVGNTADGVEVIYQVSGWDAGRKALVLQRVEP